MSSDNNQAVLAKVRALFESAVQSKAYRTWRDEAKVCWDFYDGCQWTPQEVDALSEYGQPAIVINKIASKVDNLAGSEVAGRTRVVYRSRSGVAREENAARMLTDMALYVAERGDQALEISNVFRAGLVCGVGWLDVGAGEAGEGVQVFAKCEDEFSVVWDPLSRRHDLGDMRFVARERWLDAGEVEMMFPGKSAAVMAVAGQVSRFGAYGLTLSGRGEEVEYYDDLRQVYRLVEVQYKEPAKQWRVRDANGQVRTTFEKAETRGTGVTVEQVETALRCHVAVFAGDTLLDHRAMGYAHNDFTLIPYVYKRHKADGRPYGMVRGALDPQRELNKRRSKAMHLLNTSQVIADIDAVEDPNMLAREAARPDGIILKRAGKDLRILRNTDLATSQVQVMEQAGRDIQDVIGVFDESIGKESNAVSGVAIQQRQLAGSLNQMFAFDALRLLKKKLGEQVLMLMRQFFTPEMAIRITDQLAAGRLVGLAQGLSDGGYDVVVEEVRDVMSARELEVQRLDMLMKAGVAIPPDVLVEASGVREKERILAALAAPQSNKQGA